MTAFKTFSQTQQQRIEKKLTDCVIQATTPKSPFANPKPIQLLQDAMQHAVLNGGKRVRPLLVYACGELLSVPFEKLDTAACAVELIHSYSLIHDDLPAMDDADLRRGKPACHIAFDEATAILAGDALHALAFEMLAHPATDWTAEQRCDLLTCLGNACGTVGMVGGQMLDIHAEINSIDGLDQLHQLKTGALISACVEFSMIIANQKQHQELLVFANILGLAFQVQDDILDVTSDVETLGKPPGIDAAHNKLTYPELLGLDGAKKRLLDLKEQGIKALEKFDDKADVLRELLVYVVERAC